MAKYNNSSNVKVSKSKKKRMRRMKCKRLQNDRSSVAVSEMMPVCHVETQSPTPEDQPSCEHHSSSPPSECESTTSLNPELAQCHLNPELIISETQFSPSDVSPPTLF